MLLQTVLKGIMRIARKDQSLKMEQEVQYCVSNISSKQLN